jgi:hypothetical protein
MVVEVGFIVLHFHLMVMHWHLLVSNLKEIIIFIFIFLYSFTKDLINNKLLLNYNNDDNQDMIHSSVLFIQMLVFKKLELTICHI